MSNAAPRLSNQLFQADWNSSTENQSAQEAKISYLMVEKVTPPDYLWQKISNKLDKQEATAAQLLQQPSQTKTIALLVTSALLTVAGILYWLI